MAKDGKGVRYDYNKRQFWDSQYKLAGKSTDEKTLNPELGFDPRAYYHYNQVENCILEHIHDKFKAPNSADYETATHPEIPTPENNVLVIRKS